MKHKKYLPFSPFSHFQNEQDIADFFLLFLSRLCVTINTLIILFYLIKGETEFTALSNNISLILLNVIVWLLIVKGKGRQALIIFCAGLYTIQFTAILSHGILQPAYISLLIPSLLLMLTSWRVLGLCSALLSVAVGAIIFILEINDILLVAPQTETSDERFFFVHSAIIVFISFLWYCILTAFDRLVEGIQKKEEEQRALSQKLYILQKISTVAHSSLLLDDVIDDVVAEMKKLVSFDQLSLYLIEQNQISLTWSSAEHRIETSILRDIIMTTHQIEMIFPKRDSSIDRPRISMILEEMDMSSFLFCPIISKGNKLGGIFLYSHSEQAFSADDKDTVQSIVNQLVSPLLNSQIHRMNQTIRDTEVRVLQNEKLSTLGTLATEVAHDINQPLSFVKTLLQCMIEDIENEALDAAELIEEIKLGEKYLLQISSTISNIRRFISTSNMDCITDNVNLNEVVDISLILFRETIERQKIEVSRNISDDIPSLSIPEYKLEQILINLIQNAIHAMENTIHKKLSIDVIQISEDKIQVVVADNGMGISEENQKKIFRPFFTTKNRQRGTGMGLSIISNILEDIQGSIVCSSIVGEGTKFSVVIPIHREDWQESDNNHTMSSAL